MRDQAEEAYVDAVGTSLPPSYYYRLVPAAPYLCLQYWFFYPYNDWASSFAGFNDHEGDWESMQFLFARDGGRIVEPPAFVSFVGHHSRITKPWGHPDIATQGTHVHAFVAGGSHATYPRQQDYGILSLLGLVDRASGDGRTVGPDDWAERTDLATVPWLVDYRGSWGTRYWMSLYLLMRMTASGGDPGRGPTHQPGVSAPRGPRFGDVGAEREMWADPVGFARNEPT